MKFTMFDHINKRMVNWPGNKLGGQGDTFYLLLFFFIIKSMMELSMLFQYIYEIKILRIMYSQIYNI